MSSNEITVEALLENNFTKGGSLNKQTSYNLFTTNSRRVQCVMSLDGELLAVRLFSKTDHLTLHNVERLDYLLTLVKILEAE